MHMDSTDFQVDGAYNSREEKVEAGVVHLRQGYSRDHRPDLNQVVLNVIVEVINQNYENWESLSAGYRTLLRRVKWNLKLL